MKARVAGLLLALTAIPLAHAVDEGAFARCRGIADAAARLRCYDGLTLGGPPPAPPSAPAPAAKAPPAPPPPAAPPPAPKATSSADFGLEQKAAQQLPTTMESHVQGRFEGWGPRSRITLANGQVWQIVDDTQAAFSLNNPKVVIRRGMMGGFFLDVEGFNRSPRVRRVQ